MKVLETRRDGHFTMRRKRLANGRIVKTMEIPWTLWLPVRAATMRRLPGFLKTEAARDRMVEVERRIKAGEKLDYIAAVVGLSKGRVAAISRKRKP